MKLTLEQAIACKLAFSNLGYSSKIKQNLLSHADDVIRQAAELAAGAYEAGICTKCWGDGFHRITAILLRGPCEECGGSGRIARAEAVEKVDNGEKAQ